MRPSLTLTQQRQHVLQDPRAGGSKVGLVSAQVVDGVFEAVLHGTQLGAQAIHLIQSSIESGKRIRGDSIIVKTKLFCSEVSSTSLNEDCIAGTVCSGIVLNKVAFAIGIDEDRSVSNACIRVAYGDVASKESSFNTCQNAITVYGVSITANSSRRFYFYTINYCAPCTCVGNVAGNNFYSDREVTKRSIDVCSAF